MESFGVGGRMAGIYLPSASLSPNKTSSLHACRIVRTSTYAFVFTVCNFTVCLNAKCFFFFFFSIFSINSSAQQDDEGIIIDYAFLFTDHLGISIHQMLNLRTSSKKESLSLCPPTRDHVMGTPERLEWNEIYYVYLSTKK